MESFPPALFNCIVRGSGCDNLSTVRSICTFIGAFLSPTKGLRYLNDSFLRLPFEHQYSTIFRTSALSLLFSICMASWTALLFLCSCLSLSNFLPSNYVKSKQVSNNLHIQILIDIKALTGLVLNISMCSETCVHDLVFNQHLQGNYSKSMFRTKLFKCSIHLNYRHEPQRLSFKSVMLDILHDVE